MVQNQNTRNIYLRADDKRCRQVIVVLYLLYVHDVDLLFEKVAQCRELHLRLRHLDSRQAHIRGQLAVRLQLQPLNKKESKL